MDIDLTLKITKDNVIEVQKLIEMLNGAKAIDEKYYEEYQKLLSEYKVSQFSIIE